MRRVRIGFLSHADVNLERFRLPLMLYLKERGADVFAISPDGKYAEKIEKLGIKVRRYRIDRKNMNPLREIPTIRELLRVIDEERPHILQTFTMKPNVYGGVLKRLRKIPVVISTVTGLGSIFLNAGGLSRILQSALKWSFDAVDFVVFQNDDDREELMRRGIGLREKTCVIPGSGVDTEFFDPQKVDSSALDRLRREIGIEKDNILLTFIGRFIVHKGVREFIEAARILMEESGGRLSFLMVGGLDSGNPHSISPRELEMARGAGIKILNFRDDIREIIAISHIIVLPSWREGLSRTALEAMAMEKPVVAADVPGLKDVVQDGITGVLVEPRNVQSLVGGMMRLIYNEEMRVRMGHEGRRRAISYFDVKRVVEEHLELYSMLLNRRMKIGVFR